MTGNLNAMVLEIIVKHMSGDNQGDDGDDGSDQQLPGPQVALEEVGGKSHDGSDDTTDNLRPEAQDDARDEATQTDDDALKAAVAELEDARKAHRCSADGAENTHEEPHLEDGIGVARQAVLAAVVLMQRVSHQRPGHQWDAYSEPRAPVLVPQQQRGKLQEEEERRRVAPYQEGVHGRRLSGCAHHFCAGAGDDVQFPALHVFCVWSVISGVHVLVVTGKLFFLTY